MKKLMTRPDTPLAATPEPMPVSTGQVIQKPISKYQATADAAISQIKSMSSQNVVQPQQE